jgi:sulfate transporter 4
MSITEPPSLNHPQCSFESTTYASDEEGIHSPSDYSHQLREPPELNLLHRHRAPPSSVSGADAGAVMLIRRQIERICEDSTAQVRHAVPALNGVQEDKLVDENDFGGEAHVKEDAPKKKESKIMWRSMTIRKESAMKYLMELKPFRALTVTDGTSGSTSSYCPFLRGYTLGMFGRDAAAGCTVAIMGIPLGMSYAKLAGLPAYYGLYAMFVPPLVYPFVGTSKQLQVGPAALISLLVSAGVSNIVKAEGLSMENDADRYVERYTQLSIQCAFLVGLINLLMGLLKLGFVAQFLSKALISGFTSGAAVIICLSQLKNLFGYTTPPSTEAQHILRYLIGGISQFNWKTFLMGMCSIVFLMGMKYLSGNEKIIDRWPYVKWLKALGPMIVSAVGIITVYAADLTQVIPCVGHIPSGLPIVTVSWWTPVSPSLLGAVIPMVIVGFVNSFAVSKQISYQRGYDIDSSMEFVSLGLSNLIGSMFQASPVTGTIGQSFVNDEIGVRKHTLYFIASTPLNYSKLLISFICYQAQTGIASIITGILTMLVLLFLTKVFELLPLSILAAIVISFVSAMFDYNEAIYLYKVHVFDFVVWVVALLGTVFLVSHLSLFSLTNAIFPTTLTAYLGTLHNRESSMDC